MAEANTSSGGVGSRPAPHDPDAEAQVIGAALSTASRYPRPNLIPSDFWVPAHRQLWELITTTSGPYCPRDLPADLLPAAQNAVSAWTGIDPAVPARRMVACMVARAAVTYAAALDEAAHAIDIAELRTITAALDSTLTLVSVEES
jgi:hypothetical protein